MYCFCHIRNKKFNIKKTITAGIPNTADKNTVYSLISKLIPVNFLVKYKISSRQTPVKALNKTNLSGFLVLKAKINTVKIVIENKIIIPYFKVVIKSPNIIVVIYRMNNDRKLQKAALKFKGGDFKKIIH